MWSLNHYTALMHAHTVRGDSAKFYGKVQTTYLNDENRYQTIAFWRGTYNGQAVSSRTATSRLQL